MAASDVSQGAGIGRGEVRQGVLLEIGPEGLHGVEFGSVGRKQDAVESAASVEELPDGSGAVSRKAVPHQQQRAAKVGCQIAQKFDQPGDRHRSMGAKKKNRVRPAGVAAKPRGLQ